MGEQPVRPASRKLTDADVRVCISDALIMGPCHALGPSRVAVEVGGIGEKAVRRWRDRESTPDLANALNLLDCDPHALDALAAAKGFMLVPMIQSTGADVIPAAGAAIHRIGRNRCPTSPSGTRETDDELIASEAENDALLAAVLERRSAIASAKLRKSGLAA